MKVAHVSGQQEEPVTFSDGLGVRVAALSEAGERLERLMLPGAFVPVQEAVQDRVARLQNLHHVRFARLRGFEAAPRGGTPVVISSATDGRRLSDVLLFASHGLLSVEIGPALQVTRELLAALAVLHDSRNVTHGSIAPERIVLAQNGRIVVVEHVLSQALDRLHLPRHQLWREWRIAAPPAAGPVRFDTRTDLAQTGVVVLALLLGRPIEEDEYPHRLRGLLPAVRDRLAQGGATRIARELQQWLERLLPSDGGRPYASVKEAQLAFEALVSAPASSLGMSPARVKALLAACAAFDSRPAVTAARDDSRDDSEAKLATSSADGALVASSPAQVDAPAMAGATDDVDIDALLRLAAELDAASDAQAVPLGPESAGSPGVPEGVADGDAESVAEGSAESVAEGAAEGVATDSPLGGESEAGPVPASEAPSADGHGIGLDALVSERASLHQQFEPHTTEAPEPEPASLVQDAIRWTFEPVVDGDPDSRAPWRGPAAGVPVQADSAPVPSAPDMSDVDAWLLAEPEISMSRPGDADGTVVDSEVAVATTDIERAGTTIDPDPVVDEFVEVAPVADADDAAVADADDAAVADAHDAAIADAHDAAVAEAAAPIELAPVLIEADAAPAERCSTAAGPTTPARHSACATGSGVVEPVAPPVEVESRLDAESAPPAAPASFAPVDIDADEAAIAEAAVPADVAPGGVEVIAVAPEIVDAVEVDVPGVEPSDVAVVAPETVSDIEPVAEFDAQEALALMAVDATDVAEEVVGGVPGADVASEDAPVESAPVELVAEPDAPQAIREVAGERTEPKAKRPAKRRRARRKTRKSIDVADAPPPPPPAPPPDLPPPPQSASALSARASLIERDVPAWRPPADLHNVVADAAARRAAVASVVPPPVEPPARPPAVSSQVFALLPASVEDEPPAPAVPQALPPAVTVVADLLTAQPVHEPALRPRTVVVLIQQINWRRTAAAAVLVALLETAAFGAAWWWVQPGAKGTLVVETSVPGVEVLLDGALVGHTPFHTEVRPGRHTLTLRRGAVERSMPVEINLGVVTTQTLPWPRPSSGALRVTSAPEGADVVIGDTVLGHTPLTIDDLPEGRQTLVLRSASGTVSTAATVVAGETAVVDVPIFAGWLQVHAAVELVVSIDGTRVGTNVDGQFLVSPGTHRVDVSNAALGFTARVNATVEPGKVRSLTVALPEVPLLATGPDGAEVFVDGVLRGVLPDAAITVPLGTHDVVVRSADGSERRRTLTVRAGAPVSLTDVTSWPSSPPS